MSSAPAPVKPIKKALVPEASVVSKATDISIEELIAVVSDRMGYAPSKYQRGILEWVFGGSGNAAVNAVAGSGKSSSLRMVAIALG